MKKLFLFATFLCAMCAGRVFGQEDPDIVWWKNYSPERITDVKYRPDGERIFVATEDKTLVLSAENGEIIHELPQGYEDTHRIDISQDGNYIVAVGMKPVGAYSRLIMWDLNSFQPVDTSYFDNSHLSVEDVSFIANDQFIVVTSISSIDIMKSLIILDAETLDVVKYYGEENTVFTEVAASPDGKYFATISNEDYHSGSVNKLTLWDAATFEKVKVLDESTENVIVDVSFSNTTSVLSTKKYGDIVFYNYENTSNIQKTYFNEVFVHSCARFYHFSNDFAFAKNQGACIVSNNTVEKCYDGLYAGSYVDVSPDDNYIIAGSVLILYLIEPSLTSIGYEEKANEILYPNPTTGSVIIGVTASKIKSITLSNESATLNEKIDNYQILSDSEISLDLSEYPDGVYFIRVESASGLETFKAIKGGVQ